MTSNINIGPFALSSPVVLAPMAGISDAPFRRLCVSFGAGLAATEMTTADPGLRDAKKSRNRLNFKDSIGLRVVQIAGSDPLQLAHAAKHAVNQGAQIIDINMGCPAKKVCRQLAGSALLKDEDLVRRILDSVIEAVPVPVTLKIRTGWDPTRRNGVKIAQLAEQAGIQSIAVHGRTRACAFRGSAEYETIRAIKSAVKIPVFANGDIDTPEKAYSVMKLTRADGIMIGRSSRGQPWLFQQVIKFLSEKVQIPMPSNGTRRDIILSHLDSLYRFYGEHTGVRVARKHLAWYSQHLLNSETFRHQAVRAKSSSEQMRLTNNFFVTVVPNKKQRIYNCRLRGVPASGEIEKETCIGEKVRQSTQRVFGQRQKSSAKGSHRRSA